MNIIDEAIAAVIGLMNATNSFKPVTRGALPTGDGITCEVTTSMDAEIFLDKGARIPVDLTLNGKHANLQTLSETLNKIHDTLTKNLIPGGYPSGTGWQIIDIWSGAYPHIIDRESNNEWVMASALVVNLERKGA